VCRGFPLGACIEHADYGVYLWTAGRRYDDQGTFRWLLPTRFLQTVGIWMPMTYKYWDWTTHQPDFYGGDEWCVNMWPNLNFHWNDENCGSKLCFVCENRNSYEWANPYTN